MSAPFGTVPFGGGASTAAGGVTGWGGNVTLYVEVDLSQATDDPGLNVGTSLTVWDAAMWDVDQWADGTTWTDVTADCRSVSTRREFSRQGNSYSAGTATVVLDNRSGDYSPDNTQSPYRLGDSTTIGIWRPFRIRAEYNDSGSLTEWPIFTGLVRSWEESFPHFARDATVTIEAVDGFALLGAFDGYAQTPAGASEYTGARIARILENAGYTGGSVLDTGTVTCQATTLSQNALTELKLTADSEGGWVWCGPDGRIMFDQYDAPFTKERSRFPQVYFADDGSTNYLYSSTGGIIYGRSVSSLVFEDVQGSYNGDLVINTAAYARVGSTAQVVTSQDSRVLYGPRQESRTDLICEDDIQVASVAERAVAANSRPERRVESLRFKPQGQKTDERTTWAWRSLAGQLIELRSLAHVTVTPPSGDPLDRYVFISGLSHTITADLWTVDLKFQSASVYRELAGSLWDESVWGSAAWTF